MTNWVIALNEAKTDFMITRPKHKMYTEKIRRNKLKIGNTTTEPYVPRSPRGLQRNLQITSGKCG